MLALVFLTQLALHVVNMYLQNARNRPLPQPAANAIPKLQAVMAGRYDEILDRLFNKWDFDRILPCHGNLVESGGKARLRRDLSMQD